MESIHDQIEGLGPANPTPLESAAGRGDLERVEELLDAGADPNDGVFSTPLMAVVADWEPSAQAGGIMRLLIDAGADVDVGGMPGSDQTPLHRAAMTDSRELVDLLLAEGADACRRVSEPTSLAGMTPLDIARDRGSSEAERMLEGVSSACG